MAGRRFGTAFRRWLHGMSGSTAADLPDGSLLERFVRQRDEAAFEALVHRHGPLVLGVCRNVLRDAHDAEDAFQATFLVLACRAASIRRTESVASFLYGTACRIARRLRAQNARRHALHRRAMSRLPEAPAPDSEGRDAYGGLHEELNRLPRKYRDALVLCYLQSKTNEQAARELGCPPGSMSRHLNRARELLRERLLARGAGVLAALVGPALAEQATAAAAPPPLVRATVETIRRHALAAALLADSAPPAAVALARGVLRSAWVTRLTIAATLLAVAVAGGVTAIHLSATTQPASQAKAPSSPPDAGRADTRAHRDLYGDPLPDGVLARLGTARLRHAMATHLAFAADVQTLISTGQDQVVRFWDLASGKLQRLQRLPPSQRVQSLSADGKTLALSSEEHLHLWDIATAKEIQRIPTGKLTGEKQWYAVEFSPDGKTLAAGNGDSTVFVWDAVEGKERARYKHQDRQVRQLAFSPDGKRLAAVGDVYIVVWNLADGREVRTMKEPGGYFSSRSTFSPDGKLLAEASFGDVVLWDAATWKKEAVLRFDSAAKKTTDFNNVAFSPDGKTIAIRCGDAVVLWDTGTRKERRRWETAPINSPDPGRLYFSPDGKLLACLRAGVIRLWDVAGGKPLQDRAGHSAAVHCVAFSPDGKYVASASGGDGTVRLWDAHTGKQLHVWPMPHTRIYPVLFTPDGGNVIAAGHFGDCRMWDVRGGEPRHIFRVPDRAPDSSESITDLHLSPDGKRLAALSLWSQSKDGIHKRQRYLTTWDVAGGKRIDRRPLSFDYRMILHIEQLSPDGRLAAVFDRGLLIYDVAADRPLRTLSQDLLYARLAFSPDGKLLALGGSLSEPESVRLYDVASGAEMLTLATGPAGDRAFSPDGRYLLTAGEGDLRLWELATGKEVLRRRSDQLDPSSLTPSQLAFAPDGRSVATGMPDASILIWDLAPATRRKRQLTAADLDKLWADLAGEDAARAYGAAGTLIADPQRTVPFLRGRLHPIPKEDAPRIRRLIADLDSEQFSVRDAATKALERMDDVAHPVLRQALKDATSLELRRRIQALLAVRWLVRSPEKLRQIRAVTVLEQIGDGAARRVLERLAGGAERARQTREAKAALERLNRPANGRH